MVLVQVFLPLYDNEGKALPRALFDTVREELVAQFGGLTSYPRAPASGLWRDGGEVKRDDIIVHEVLCDAVDREWWKAYRTRLEARFRQQEVLVRAMPVEVL